MSTPPIEGVDVQMGNDHGACHYLLAFRPVAWSRLPCEDQYDHANLVSLERLSHGVLNRSNLRKHLQYYRKHLAGCLAEPLLAKNLCA